MSQCHSLDQFAARLREFISSRSLGRSSDADVQFDLLARYLFALQFRQNSAYQRLCEARDLSPQTIGHWSEIPAVSAAAFKEMDVTCLPAEERQRVFLSSGTTEQRPSRHFHNTASLTVYEASLVPWFQEHLLPKIGTAGALMLCLTPSRTSAPRSSLAYMFGVVRERYGSSGSVFAGVVAEDGAWHLDLKTALSVLKGAVETRRPLMILGTAFSFVHLLDALAERHVDFQLPAGSSVMETGGYKGRSRSLPKDALHALITARLGVPKRQIVCEYGMSELSSQAYDHRAGAETGPTGRIFRFPPWAHLQIISPETGSEVKEGETGLIRILDLANVYSVMAIQTEDLGIRRGEGFELAGRAILAEPRGCSLMLT